MLYYEKNDGLEESDARRFFLSSSLVRMLFCFVLTTKMTTSLIYCCLCLGVVSLIVIAVETALMRTVAIVRCKSENAKNVVNVRSFVLTALYTCMHISFSATNTDTSFICCKAKAGEKREEERK